MSPVFLYFHTLYSFPHVPMNDGRNHLVSCGERFHILLAAHGLQTPEGLTVKVLLGERPEPSLALPQGEHYF